MIIFMMKLENGEHYILVNGIRHWCKIAGVHNGGTPLVIMHGGPGGNHYVFERTIGPKLEELSTVIYYEQRGSGRTEQPADEDAYSVELLVSDFRGLLEELGLKKVSLLGYSFGGELAMEYTLAHPETVEKLILQGTSINDIKRTAYIQSFGFLQVAEGEIKQRIVEVVEVDSPIEQKIDKIWGMVDSKTVDRLLFYNEEFARFNRSMWQESKLTNTGLMFKALQKQHRAPILDRVEQIKQQTLFLIGLYDRNTGIEISRDLMTKISNAEMETFTNSAHFPDIEETEKYARVVREFLHK